MPAKENVGADASRRTEEAPEDLRTRVVAREPIGFRFDDDGFVPNHPAWPLIIYKAAIRLSGAADPAAVFESLFARHGWGRSWRNGIYSYPHYHAGVHEALGIASGGATVRFGGQRGQVLSLEAGDVAILPAGTGHQRISSTEDLLVVGAYPASGPYDLCTKPSDRAPAIATIAAVERPAADPVYGIFGPLIRLW